MLNQASPNESWPDKFYRLDGEKWSGVAHFIWKGQHTSGTNFSYPDEGDGGQEYEDFACWFYDHESDWGAAYYNRDFNKFAEFEITKEEWEEFNKIW